MQGGKSKNLIERRKLNIFFVSINICIGVMMILIIFINVLTTAFSGPENQDKPNP